MKGLQGLGGFDQNTVLRPLAGAHHDGHRGGQSQGTGAGNHQHRHTGGEGLGSGVSGDQPSQGGDEGDAHDHWHENAGNLVSQLGDGGFRRAGLLHQADHLGQGGVLPHPAGLKGEEARFIDGGGGHLVPRALVHRERLAGEGGFVHGGLALHNDAVHRDGLARPDHNPVPHLNLLHGDLHLGALPQDGGCLRGQVHQAADGLAGFALGPGLQKFPQGNEGEDHTRRLKVQVHVVLGHQVHVTMAQAVPHLVDGENAVDDGGGGAHGNEAVHIGRSIPKGFKAHFIILIVEIHNRQGEQQLGQPEGHRILVPHQKGGQRRAHHVAHGDIEQRNQEHKGPDHPVLHPRQLLGHNVLCGGRLGLCACLLRQGCPVSGLYYRLDNILSG